MRAALALLAALVVATFPGAGSAAARQIVTMWFWGASPAYRAALERALVQPFERSQDRYRLVIEYRASVDNDVRVAVMGGSGPDLIYTSGPPDVTPMARAGKLAPLDRYDALYGWSTRLLAPVIDSCRQLGHLMCIPPSLEADGMFYNKAVLRRYGWSVPQDGAALLALMRAAQAKGLYASVMGNKGWQPVNEDLASIFLNQMVGADGLANLLQGRDSWSGAPMQSAVQTLDRWFHAGFFGGSDYFSLNFDLALLLMSEGRSPLMFAPSMLYQWAGNYFDAAHADDLGFAPFPRLDPAVPYPLFDIGTSFTYSINAGSAVKDGAAAVLDRMLSPAFAIAISRDWPGYWAPPLVEFPIDPQPIGLLAGYDRAMGAITDAVRQGHYGFQVGTFFPPATRDVFVQDLEAVWVDEETPAQMLRKAGRAFARERALGLVGPVASPIPR